MLCSFISICPRLWPDWKAFFSVSGGQSSEDRKDIDASMLVYLAGPISGTSYNQSTGWRTRVANRIYPHEALSPMRGKSYLSSEEAIADFYSTPLSCAKGIITRDRWDVMRCHVLLVNVLGATKVSIGTMMELAWADAYRKPVVLVMEKEGNPHDHAFVREIAGFWLPTLDEAIKIVNQLGGVEDVGLIQA